MPALLAGALFVLGTRDRDTTVPDLRGMTVREAMALAQRSHLGLLEEGRVAPPAQDLQITGQRPAPGASAPRGSAVILTVRSPVAPVTVPDLTALSPAEARAKLAEVGLRLGVVQGVAQASAVAGASVTRQSIPARSTADRGVTVDVWVAGAGTPRAPSFVGMTREQASTAASGAGIELVVSEEPAEALPPDHVIRQSPPPGATLSDRRVAVVVSAEAAAGGSGTAPPPRIYTALAGIASFPVLYPAMLPAGLELDTDGTNPKMVDDPTGESGFELRYVDPARPSVRLSLLEGRWFDPAIDAPSTVTVRGTSGSLGSYPGGEVLDLGRVRHRLRGLRRRDDPGRARRLRLRADDRAPGGVLRRGDPAVTEHGEKPTSPEGAVDRRTGDGPAPVLFQDRYELGPILGRGGTCTVYRAWDTRLHRDVALKRLEPPLSEDEHTRARFNREGKAIARLSHPSLVTLIDRGSTDDTEYLVYEYVEGRSLKQVVTDEGPLEPKRAARIAGQVAEGLSAAHAAGIYHRDVKPQNILLEAEGRARLTDFGIATGPEWTRMTRAGAIVGSSRYMSPEQVQGRPVDARTDIYSLGIVLYEMVAGRPPFDGTTIAEIGRQHIRAEPAPLDAVRPDLPPGLGRVVARCLEKLPESRFQSMDELLGALVALDLYELERPAAGVFDSLRKAGHAIRASAIEAATDGRAGLDPAEVASGARRTHPRMTCGTMRAGTTPRTTAGTGPAAGSRRTPSARCTASGSPPCLSWCSPCWSPAGSRSYAPSPAFPARPTCAA